MNSGDSLLKVSFSHLSSVIAQTIADKRNYIESQVCMRVEFQQLKNRENVDVRKLICSQMKLHLQQENSPRDT